jgi:guanylate kinase
MTSEKRRQASDSRTHPLIFVLSGPSGSGKTTLAQKLVADKEFKKALVKSISLTTRKRRSGERHGRDYFFITANEFRHLREGKKILEWTRYLGYYYATSKDVLDCALQRGKSIVLCLDNRGARRIKRVYRDKAVTIFVAPPSLASLETRIRQRCSRTTDKEIQQRMRSAAAEMGQAEWYDSTVHNDDLNEAFMRLKGVVAGALCAAKAKG